MTDPRDPSLADELSAYGGKTIEACRTCRNCSAECPLSREATRNLRKAIHRLQSNQREELAASPEPWLSCYCAECSTACPHDASPGELMTALRRYLTACYDWTGLSRRLFLSPPWQIGVTAGITVIVTALFALSGAFRPERMATPHVSLHTFMPVGLLQYANRVLGGLVLLLLAVNAYRMKRSIIGGDKGLVIPLLLYTMELTSLFGHGLKQLRRGELERRSRWIGTLLLVAACTGMLLLTMVFLPRFYPDTAAFHMTSIFGYFATAVFLCWCTAAVFARWRGRESVRARFHRMDWAFVVQLSLTGTTGLGLGVFRLLDLPYPTYVIYVLHLGFVVSLLVVQVPFGTWSGLLYRPLAAYLVGVQLRAREYGFLRAP